MIQGWHKNDYLILFEEQEALQLTERYAITDYLPGYILIGLRGWDDFILRNTATQFFTVPTVPLDAKYLKPFKFEVDTSILKPDEQFTDKIKWYIKPVIFGGAAGAGGSNTTWITLQQHIEAVKWWNQKYNSIKQNKVSA